MSGQRAPGEKGQSPAHPPPWGSRTIGMKGAQLHQPSVASSQCSYPPYRLQITFLYIKATYPIPLIVQELQTPYCPYNIEQAAKTTEKKGAERTSYKTPPSYANTSLSITKDVTLYCKWASLLLLDQLHQYFSEVILILSVFL